MDFDDAPDDADFRAQARAWLSANAPRKPAGPPRHWVAPRVEMSAQELDEREREEIARARAWQRKLYESGWAGISWPKEYGGRGGTPVQAAIFAEELAAFDVPAGRSAVSMGMVGPTLLAHGTAEQKQRHVPAILRGEIWCQLFSEPSAGSDLAGLRTRADRTDDGWLVNGQKVWTSGARVSKYGALVARTDGSKPKHRGLSYFIVDMSTPGIDIRPLRQMNGAAHFNEVYLTDVRLPADAIVGDLNDGWRVANTMLLNERGQMGNAVSDFELIVELARLRERSADPVVRQEIAKVYAREQIVRLLGFEARTALNKGTSAPAIASISKLLTSYHERDLTRFALDLLGPEGMVSEPDGYLGGQWQFRFLSAPLLRIAGGTDEVQKNILGERFLGLPPDYRPDKNVAFNDIPKA